MQKDMVDVLQAEGFQINDRELMRLRLRFKWFLRESRTGNGKRRQSADSDDENASKARRRRRKIGSGNGLIDQLANAILQEESEEDEGDSEEGTREEQAETAEVAAQTDLEPQPQLLDPSEAMRRQLRQQQLQVDSDEKWRARKRRRRTRGWAGLPADAPGEPPRFPSETTLDESKAYLELDNKMYKEMRVQFQAMCQEEGVIKKTIAGPERWAQLLRRLIRENAHLTNVFQHEQDEIQQNDALWRPKNQRVLSLDVICQDVTKRLRTMDSRMGIPEAKNALNLNPEQTRQVRSAFMAILKADHFTNKFEAGDQHWNELKQQWVQESELLSRIMGPAGVPAGQEADPKHTEQLRAVEVLARDVMKRLRAENTLNDPARKKQTHQGPGPGPAPPSGVTHVSNSLIKTRSMRVGSGAVTNSSSILHHDRHRPRDRDSRDPTIATGTHGTDLQIDPSLLLAASDASIITMATSPHAPTTQGLALPHAQHQHHPLHITNPHASLPGPSTYASPAHMSSSAFLHSPPTPTPLPIYFRLHPHSSTPFPNKTVWLSVLQTGTVAEVKSLAMREHAGTVVARLEGVVVHRAESGEEREVCIGVDDDEELSAFLGHVGAGSGKATFVVLLGMGEPDGDVYMQA